MGMTIRKETAYWGELDDQPGMLAQALQAVADAGINLSLLAGRRHGSGRARIYCIPDDVQRLRGLAQSYGAPLHEQTVFTIRGDDQPGTLAEVIRKLGDAGINIRDLAALSVGGQFAAAVAVADADVARTAAALGC